MNERFTSMLGGLLIGLFAAVPATSNYQLNNYSFGNGGGTGTTSNYSIEGISGEQNGALSGTVNYNVKPGLLNAQMANVPGAPAFTNPASWYNKLQIIIDTAGNPSDATFAVAISDDNFVTTQYVQSDMTIGPALGVEDYLTYAGWGSGSGSNIIGLASGTTYQVKVKASRGDFTESGYGPAATASTSNVQLTFDIDISSTDSETASPYSLAIGDLLVDTVATGSDKIWLDLDTNAESGARIFLFGLNTGLRSTSLAYTVTSASGDLTALNEGFGLQSSSATQSSGGPIAPLSPYDGAGNNVGVIDTAIRPLYSSTASITGGRVSLDVKAKASQTTPAADDYQDILTIIAAANY